MSNAVVPTDTHLAVRLRKESSKRFEGSANRNRHPFWPSDGDEHASSALFPVFQRQSVLLS